MRSGPPLILLSALLGTACASTGPQSAEEYVEADWIVGAWRIDSFLRAGSQRRDILLQLDFKPTGHVDVVDQTTSSRLATQCRWYSRVNWIETSCRGVDIRILPDDEGSLDVELAGTIRVPSTTEECARWGVDETGARICLKWVEVERFRNVPARGQGILEPFRAWD
jgi:hypothetical protein